MKFGKISSETLAKRLFGCLTAIAVLLSLPLLSLVFAPHGDINSNYEFLFFIHSMRMIAVSVLSIIVINLICDVIYRILKKVETKTQTTVPEAVKQINTEKGNE